MAQKLGADTALMGHVQVHPTGLVDPAAPRAPEVFFVLLLLLFVCCCRCLLSLFLLLLLLLLLNI